MPALVARVRALTDAGNTLAAVFENLDLSYVDEDFAAGPLAAWRALVPAADVAGDAPVRPGEAPEPAGETTAPDGWEAEVRGLGWMILNIAHRYAAARQLGGDDELLRSAISSADAYVQGPLRDRLGPLPDLT